MMSKFHFRLATLLKLRETARDERRMELAEAHRADAELERRLEQLDAQRKQLQRECREAAGPGPIDLRRLIEAQRYASTLRARVDEVQRQRQTLAMEIDRRRQAAIEADREVRTLEKLRNHQAQAHRQQDDRQEAKRLDEAALQTAGSCWSEGE